MKCSFGISNFLEEISSLSHSIIFLCFFALISLRKAFLSLLANLWNSAFKWMYLSFSPLPLASLFSQLFVRPPQTSIFPFAFLFLWDGLNHCLLYNVTNFHPQFFRHSIRSNPLNSICHFHCIIVKDLILVIPERSCGFPYFLQFKSELGNNEFMS